MDRPLVPSSSGNTHDGLPRLMYVGDQPIESTVGGPAQLYRLLQTYPPDRLLIVESNLGISRPDRRLSDVQYEFFSVGWPRLTRSRFRARQAAVLHAVAPLRQYQLRRVAAAFRPEAVLTISHLHSWRTAAAMAKSLRLPLHLILHDDCVRMSFVPRWLEGSVGKCLGDVYRSAQSRLCIAPMMESHYRTMYGVPGSIVMPMWAADAPALEPVLPTDRGEKLTFVYAGSLHVGGYAGNLAPLAAVLQSLGHRLLLFAGVKQQDLAAFGLDLPNVVSAPFTPYKQLIARVREEADVVVAPMSFEPQLALDMKLCFPSKLADYTSMGLPLLVWGPPYCSAVDWARRNPGIGEIVTEPNMAELEKAVIRLQDADHRRRSAFGASEAGRRSFSHEVVFGGFRQALTSTVSR